LFCKNNYNIKSLNNKQNLIYNFLINKLPKKIRAFKHKSFKSKRTKPTKESLTTAKWIELNKEVCNFIIVDIDNKDLKVHEIFQILNDYNIPFTWLAYTKKGYHIAWALEHPFVLNPKYQTQNDKKAEKYARYIQKKLIKLLNADIAAARLKGLWRNPITNNAIFFMHNKYELNELDIFLYEIDCKNCKENKRKKKKGTETFHKHPLFVKEIATEILENPLKLQEISQGLRNSLIWYLGMLIAKPFQNLEKEEKVKIFNTQILEKIYFYNNNLKKPLEKKELKEITNSIFKYFMQKKIYASLGEFKNWNKQTKNEYMKQYRIRKGIHKRTREQQKNINFEKVKEAIKEATTITEAIKKSGLSKRTFYKYYNQIKETRENLYIKIRDYICDKNNCMFTKSIHLQIVEKINKKELHLIEIKPVITALNYINTNIKRRQTCRTKQRKQ